MKARCLVLLRFRVFNSTGVGWCRGSLGQGMGGSGSLTRKMVDFGADGNGRDWGLVMVCGRTTDLTDSDGFAGALGEVWGLRSGF